MNHCKNCKWFHYDQEIGSMGWGLCGYIIKEKGLIRNPDVYNANTKKHESTRVFVHEDFGCMGFEEKNESIRKISNSISTNS